MKQILFLLFTALLFSRCATNHETLPYWESMEYNSSQKNFPGISISPSQNQYDYFRDSNGAIHQNENNSTLMNVDTLDSYYRMLKRNRNLPENKYHEKMINKELQITPVAPRQEFRLKEFTRS